MTMSDRSLKEQVAINLLWKLKRTIDKTNKLQHKIEHPDEKFKSTIDFISLLKDEEYRNYIINENTSSADARIQKAAKELKALNISGEISQSSKQSSNTKLNTSPQLSAHTSEQPYKKRSLINRLAPLFVSLGVTAFLSVILFNMFFNKAAIIEVNKSISSNTIWRANNTYQLNNLIFVQKNATLTIEAGTKIIGKEGSALIVTKTGQLLARGKKEKPIIFTSAERLDERAPGDWGGLVMLGDAPTNAKTINHIEGINKNDSRGSYGGQNSNNSCGVLKYVRIEYAGYEIGAQNELNGLTLGGCGSATIIDYVQIHRGYDDGLEIFGGDVNIKHVVISQTGDDGLDWDKGWTGKGQFIFIQQTPDEGDNAIEADNNANDYNALPRSAPILANITLLGSGQKDTDQQGILLRRGSMIHLYNSIIEGFSNATITIRDTETINLFSDSLNEKAILSKNVFASKAGLPLFSNSNPETEYLLQQDDSLLLLRKSVFTPKAYEYNNPRPIINAAIENAKSELPINSDDEFFTKKAHYTGAFNPKKTDLWIDGWTNFK